MSQENTNKSGDTDGGGGGGGGGPTSTNPFAALTSMPTTTTSGLFGDRDQMLAYFQELTSIEDIDQCQALLESTNWDLDQAVQSFYNGDTGMPHINDDDDVGRVVEGLNVVGASARFTSGIGDVSNGSHHINANIFSRLNQDPFNIVGGPTNIDHASIVNQMREEMFQSGVSPPLSKRLLNFHIEYLDKKFTLHIMDTECVRKIKELVREKIAIPCEHQKLNGWRNKDLYITDNMVLNQLSLPLDTHLFVINTSDSKVASSKEASIGGVAFASGSNDPSHSEDFDGMCLLLFFLNSYGLH